MYCHFGNYTHNVFDLVNEPFSIFNVEDTPDG